MAAKRRQKAERAAPEKAAKARTAPPELRELLRVVHHEAPDGELAPAAHVQHDAGFVREGADGVHELVFLPEGEAGPRWVLRPTAAELRRAASGRLRSVKVWADEGPEMATIKMATTKTDPQTDPTTGPVVEVARRRRPRTPEPQADPTDAELELLAAVPDEDGPDEDEPIGAGALDALADLAALGLPDPRKPAPAAKAKAKAEEEDDEELGEDDDDLGLSLDDLAALLQLDDRSGKKAAMPEPPAGPSPSVVKFLNAMVAAEGLELTEGAQVEDLAELAEPFIEGRGSAERRAKGLVEALLDHPAVEDVFVSDDDLEAILDKW